MSYVGFEMGRLEIKNAKKYSVAGLILLVCLTTTFCLIFWFCRYQWASFYSNDSET